MAMVLAPLLTGCGRTSRSLRTEGRYDKGLVIVLPGIEGQSTWNRNIAKGLARGGVESAIEIYDWTTGTVLLFAVNLRALERNKAEARRVAERIMDYQDRYPGRPVHLFGHSGGGGEAVLILEALPPKRKISAAFLLAAAIGPEYDLRRALRRTEYGIYNFYSPYDIGFLKAGTTMMGTIDGRHTSAAGNRGFKIPWGMDSEGRRLYGEKLHQQIWIRKMRNSGHRGGHFGWADPRFVADWLAPIVLSQVDATVRYASDEKRPSSESDTSEAAPAPPEDPAPEKMSKSDRDAPRVVP
jgi:pimeloyl-ACP methyl ester carboxylesterase